MRMVRCLAIILWAVLLPAHAHAASSRIYDVHLAFFYGRGCPHCAKMKSFLESLKPEYPQLKVHEYEIYFNPRNARLFERVAEGYGVPIEGVPTVFIGDTAIGGFSSATTAFIQQQVEQCSKRDCGSPLIHAARKVQPVALTLSAVLAAAAVDAINPCAFAVLIILLTAILASGNRRRALRAGLAFSLSIFISYYLMGLGLYSAIQAAGATRSVYLALAGVAILIGLFNLKDYLWYGRWFTMEVPQAWRPALKRLLQGVTSVPGAFLIGFVVSLFLLPCTSGPYVIILGLLAKTQTRANAMLWLLLYNLIFILPMLFITAAVYLSLTSTQSVESWRGRHLPMLHLVAGIVMLLLGIAMLASVWFGWA